MGDQIRIPRVVIICFFFFFSLPFSKAIFNTAELPSLRNIVSSLYQNFVPRFTTAVFMCIHLHYRIHKQRDTSFELSSILWTVDLSKHWFNHGLNLSKIHTARQFCDFQCLLFLFRILSTVKPVWLGTFVFSGNETSIITGNFCL